VVSTAAGIGQGLGVGAGGGGGWGRGRVLFFIVFLFCGGWWVPPYTPDLTRAPYFVYVSVPPFLSNAAPVAAMRTAAARTC